MPSLPPGKVQGLPPVAAAHKGGTEGRCVWTCESVDGEADELRRDVVLLDLVV